MTFSIYSGVSFGTFSVPNGIVFGDSDYRRLINIQAGRAERQSKPGIVYSGGRTDARGVSRLRPAGNPCVLHTEGYPYTFYAEAGQWTGYRYMDFPRKLSAVEMSVCTQGAGGIVEIRRGSSPGGAVSRIALPDTGGAGR